MVPINVMDDSTPLLMVQEPNTNQGPIEFLVYSTSAASAGLLPSYHDLNSLLAISFIFAPFSP